MVKKIPAANASQDAVATMLISHGERLERIEEQTAKLEMFGKLMSGQDKMISILERVD